MSTRAPAVLINEVNLEKWKLWKIYQVKIERPPRCSTNLRPDFETFPRQIHDRSLRHKISPVPTAKRGIRTIGCHQLSPEFLPFNEICRLETLPWTRDQDQPECNSLQHRKFQDRCVRRHQHPPWEKKPQQPIINFSPPIYLSNLLRMGKGVKIIFTSDYQKYTGCPKNKVLM